MSSINGQLRLRTTNLIIRPFTAQDAPSFHELESNPEVVRYQEFEPRTYEEAASLVQDNIDDLARTPLQHVELVVVRKSASADGIHKEAATQVGTFLGRIGSIITTLRLNDETNGPAEPANAASLYFSFLPIAQGKGYATEAMQAFVLFLESCMPETRIKVFEIECDPRNARSWKLAQRLGFVKEEEIEEAYQSKGELVGSCTWRLRLK